MRVFRSIWRLVQWTGNVQYFFTFTLGLPGVIATLLTVGAWGANLPGWLLILLFLFSFVTLVGVVGLVAQRFVPRMVSFDALPMPIQTDWPVSKVPPGGTVKPGQSYYKGVTLRLADLAPEGRLEGMTFEDCLLIGPAILVSPSGMSVYEAILETQDLEYALYEITTPRRVIGPISVVNCVFRRCRFRYVGMMGPREQLAEARKAYLGPAVTTMQRQRRRKPTND